MVNKGVKLTQCFIWKIFTSDEKKRGSLCSTHLDMVQMWHHGKRIFFMIGRLQNPTECRRDHERRLGMVASVMAFTSAPMRAKFCQAVTGVLLWRHGCPIKVFQSLNSLGISQSLPSARGHVDRLRAHHDDEIKLWKDAIEASILDWNK